MASEFARLLDPSELDALTGPHGKMSITMTSSDAEQEAEIVIPKRVTCARCDGGGCDSCHRSGAIRLDLSEEERTTHFVFPAAARDVRIRLAHPIAGLDLLTVEVRVMQSTALAVRPETSGAVVRRSSGNSLDLRSIVIAVAVALAAAFAFAVTR